MKAKSRIPAVVSVIVLLQWGCSNELPPNHHQLRSEFQNELPEYYELSSFHVGRYHRVSHGDTASFQAPVHAVVKVRENLYSVDSRYADTVIATVSTPGGQTRSLRGIVVLHRYRDWEKVLSVDLGLVPSERPRDSLAASRLLIKGSAEEQQWSRQHRLAIERMQQSAVYDISGEWDLQIAVNATVDSDRHKQFQNDNFEIHVRLETNGDVVTGRTMWGSQNICLPTIHGTVSQDQFDLTIVNKGQCCDGLQSKFRGQLVAPDRLVGTIEPYDAPPHTSCQAWWAQVSGTKND
jgi:hypothetical protein